MINNLFLLYVDTFALQGSIANNFMLDSNFFITILSGVILALVFQIILTAISVAAGVTSIGNLKSSYAESKAKVSENEQDENDTINAGVKYTSLFGIWSLVTTSIALFGATALALNISTMESSASNITTALVIWGLFFLILFYLETRIVGSLLGNLVTTITNGFRNSASAITSMFETKPYQKVDNILDHTIDKVRSEFDNGMDSDTVNSVIDHFFSRIDERTPNLDTIKKDLEDIAKESKSENSTGKWMAIQQMVTSAISENSKSPDADKQSKAQKLKEAVTVISENFDQADSREEGVKNVVEEFTSLDKKEIDTRSQKIKDYISNATPEDLSADKLGTLLKGAINHPKMIKAILKDQTSGLDRENIINILSNNSNLNKEDIRDYADKIENLFKTVSNQVNQASGDELLNKVSSKVTAYFTGADSGSSFELKDLGRKVQNAVYNPNKSLADIKSQLASLDLETVKKYISDNKYVEESQVDDVINSITSAKEQLAGKVEKIEEEALKRVKKIERKAVIKAEHARETAMSAAWWLVLTTILSAVAAMVGSVVTIS
ncbi:hypothetical protein [Zobellia alginiliquefaciens]|uniref:hypothetical protein n=1 Tax=Zobellia alginiliquefaciens TaxID=3032586 RepID=UPI0023E45861|nr:hypothetical protein [Zobellia alginiliquefaciens]